MKTRGIIGKRIVAIKQQVVSRGHGYLPANTVFYIELEDGTRLTPRTDEGEAEYFTDFIVSKPATPKS